MRKLKVIETELLPQRHSEELYRKKLTLRTTLLALLYPSLCCNKMIQDFIASYWSRISSAQSTMLLRWSQSPVTPPKYGLVRGIIFLHNSVPSKNLAHCW